MVDFTENFDLIKPSSDEFYDIEIQNENMNIIDRNMFSRKPTSLTSSDDLNKITKVGFYFWSLLSNGTPLNSPKEDNMKCMIVYPGYSALTVVQEVFSTVLEDTTNNYGCRMRRIVFTSGEVTPWEWINPPMLNEIEYRTTERYLGKPVYTLTVSFDEIPATYYADVFIEGSSVITLTEATTNSECVVEHTYFQGNGNQIQFVNPKDTAITNVIATVKYIYNG